MNGYERCARCGFWEKEPSKVWGKCLARPPYVYCDDEGIECSAWPVTRDVDRCGCFKESCTGGPQPCMAVFNAETTDKETAMFEKMFDFNGLFGKIGPGMCRLSTNGGIAVKTSNGYKTYNVKTGKLVNCSNFCFDIGDEWFFSIPTNKVNVGDIILVNRTPRCAIEVKKNVLMVTNYETNAIETIIPERHVFMGNAYFYGRIMSPFGNMFGKKGNVKGMLQLMMMSKMLGAGGSADLTGSGSQVGNLMMLGMMCGGGGGSNIFSSMFDGMLDEADDDDDDEEDDGKPASFADLTKGGDE